MSDLLWDEENQTSNSFSTPSKNPPHDGADSSLLAISHSEVLKGIWVNCKHRLINAGRARDMDIHLVFPHLHRWAIITKTWREQSESQKSGTRKKRREKENTGSWLSISWAVSDLRKLKVIKGERIYHDQIDDLMLWWPNWCPDWSRWPNRWSNVTGDHIGGQNWN